MKARKVTRLRIDVNDTELEVVLDALAYYASNADSLVPERDRHVAQNMHDSIRVERMDNPHPRKG